MLRSNGLRLGRQFNLPRRRIGISLGLVAFAVLLAGYARVRPVLKNYALVHAIHADDTGAARAAIRQGADVNARVIQDETEGLMDALAGRRLDDLYDPIPMLSIAADTGHADMVQFLVSSGADVNVKSDEDWTPLMFAVSSGNVESVQCLISHGADVNAVTGDDGTPVLSFAYKHPEIRQILLAAGTHDREAQASHR